MKAEDKQALIEWCEWRIARGSKSNMSEQTLKAAKITLAALTAQPVDLPDNLPCKGAPQFVWLQVSCGTGNPSEWSEHPEAGVTWHTEQIHSDDVLYIRANSDEVQE